MASQDVASMVQGSGAYASPRQEVIIHRTVRDVGGANWLVLTRTNYGEWAVLMKVKLRARKLWRAIEEGTEDEEEDCAAMEAILSAVPHEYVESLGAKDSAKAAWDALMAMRIGSDRAKKAKAQQLRREYEALAFRDGEAVEDFSLRLQSLVSQLAAHGVTITDEEAVAKYLRVVPPKYAQIALSIETLIDMSTLTIEDVTGRLGVVDDRVETATISTSDKLLLPEEEWAAHMHERRPGEGSSNRGGYGKHRGKAPQKKKDGNNARPIDKDTCRRCGKTGHWARDCKNPKKEKREAHLAQVDDEEPALLMATTCKLHDVEPELEEVKAAATEQGKALQAVHLDESSAQVHLGRMGGGMEQRWYLDSGASNHMTGSKEAFSELDDGVTGTVKFGDGSKLRSSIISIGQLDEHGCEVLVKGGVLKLQDQEQRLLAKVQRSRNRLYLLDLKVEQPVCLAVRHTEEPWLWHARFGHLSFDALGRLRNMVRGLPHIEHVGELCDSCLAGKQRRLPFPKATKYHAADVLELVHGDLCGPITPATHGGRRYFLLLVDDCSRYMWLHLLTSKDQTTEAIKQFQTRSEAESGKRLRVLRTDRGGEFTSVEFAAQPDVSFLRTFGCIGHVKKTKPFLSKLEDRSTPMVFLGYEEGSKAYRLYDPRGGKGVVSRDVVYDEMAAWDWENPGTGEARGVGGTFVIEHLVIHGGGDAGSEEPAADAPSPATVVASVKPQSPAMGTGEESPPAAAHTPPPQSPAAAGQGTPPATTVEFTSPPSNIDEYVDAFHDGEEVRFRRMDNLVGNSVVPGLASRLLEDQELLFVSAEEPSTFAQDERDASWRRAMLEEMKAIEENETWELVDPPPGCHPIGLKWVYKVKRDESGAIVKHKARLVARGFVQRKGIDFEEVFAPVARMESVRLLLAMAAAKDWRIHHLDVKSAFLNGELAETVYVKQAPGFAVKGEEHKVLRCERHSMGCDKPRERGTPSSMSPWEELIVGVYVDDLIITGAREGDINGFKREMAARFRMSDLGQLSYYLGIEVKQGRDSITLCQRGYARKLLERSGMADCKSCATPMEERLKLTKASTAAKVDATLYRSIVGGLRYLVHTRPDIAFAVGYVSRFMEDPREDHWAAVKRLLRYVKGTVDQGIIFPKTGDGSELRLTVFSDADMAGDIDGRKSTSGVLVFLGSAPISWQSLKQKIVALSTCEAEYVAAATTACQVVWLRRLLGELTGKEARPPALMVDNQPAIALANNPVLHDRSKHIDTRFHFIRDCINEGHIVLEFVESGRQLADILTKPLGRLRFMELRTKIGMVGNKQEQQD
ncbi:cysteine-rich RLK (RECEPTOR-like protein kinase) 8 [Striga hermonthica]|uniref:Cysteine-rich RLK (RECEPTOR-like protein kinase) 8 n=1 Tax=Striga hermonthica TaxID=68872 RepID=A0A9N7P0J0_STRHE|nr:cysteine-rich RLK (RECEPTOR-like protein kinase) 8 [Striga hermonthica]